MGQFQNLSLRFLLSCIIRSPPETAEEVDIRPLKVSTMTDTTINLSGLASGTGRAPIAINVGASLKLTLEGTNTLHLKLAETNPACLTKVIAKGRSFRADGPLNSVVCHGSPRNGGFSKRGPVQN